jgi:3-phenylpropionate/cinnamic acid dioxygenase small subunit
MSDFETASELYARYAAGMDTKQFELTRGVFAEQAKFRFSMRGVEAIEPVVGRDPIGDFCEQTTHEQDDQRRHLVSNVRTERVDGELVSHAVLTLCVTKDEELKIHCTGTYRNVIVEEEGEPRFAEMHISLDGQY